MDGWRRVWEWRARQQQQVRALGLRELVRRCAAGLEVRPADAAARDRLHSRILHISIPSYKSRMKTAPLLTSPHASCLAGRTVAAAWLQPLTSGMHARCFSGVISDDLDQP